MKNQPDLFKTLQNPCPINPSRLLLQTKNLRIAMPGKYTLAEALEVCLDTQRLSGKSRQQMISRIALILQQEALHKKHEEKKKDAPPKK